MTLNAGQYWTIISFPRKLTVSITVSQGVYVLDCGHWMKVFAPQPPSFLNVPMILDLLHLLKQQLSNEKIWCFETNSCWSKINFSLPINKSRDMLKHLFDLSVHVTDFCCMLWREKFELSFPSHKTSLCSRLPHFDGVTLNNIGCVYLREMHAHWSSCVRIWKREAVVV